MMKQVHMHLVLPKKASSLSATQNSFKEIVFAFFEIVE